MPIAVSAIALSGVELLALDGAMRGVAGTHFRADPAPFAPVHACSYRDRIKPPSMRMFWPVMYAASSEARKAMVAAISSLVP